MAVFCIFVAEIASAARLFVQDNEKIEDKEDNSAVDRECERPPKHRFADHESYRAEIHWVSRVFVEAVVYESLRRVERRDRPLTFVCKTQNARTGDDDANDH